VYVVGWLVGWLVSLVGYKGYYGVGEWDGVYASGG